MHLACGESDGGAEERMVTTELTLGKNVPKVPQKTQRKWRGGKRRRSRGPQTNQEGRVGRGQGEHYYGLNKWVVKLNWNSFVEWSFKG